MRATAQVSHVALPTDVRVVRVIATEGLSVLFDVFVDLESEDAEIDLDGMLWSTCSVAISPDSAASPPRVFHGVVEEARYTGRDLALHRYRLRLRPSIHGLQYRVRSRIFQEKTSDAIAKEVLEGAGIAADVCEWHIEGTYPERPYCTQWKESELAFVLRLLEEEGIFFWFEHTEVDHTIHFGDAVDHHETIAGNVALPVDGVATEDHEAIWDIVARLTLTHDAVKTRDWEFLTPQAPLEVESGDEGLRLRYEYPGFYPNQSVGDLRTNTRLEEAVVARDTISGRSNSPRFSGGLKFDLTEVAPAALSATYVLTSVEHLFEGETGAAREARHVGSYTNRFTAIPDSTTFRPRRVTPRPTVSGLESAVVTGPAGEEIHVDEFGRIKVHFYWDRENPVDDTASCWIRFQQLNTTGAMILPRLGWEVHVAFENGDPDRPIAIHKAYNQETLPPYAQPANKTQSALQSSTSPGGGSTNEIRMQDGSGGMEWFMHASKDLNVLVANDENETIGVDASESVGAVLKTVVGASESGSVGGNQAVTVAVDATFETTGAKAEEIGGNDDWGITGNLGIGTSADRTDDIGGLMNVLANKIDETFNADCSRTVGAAQAIVSATAIAETVGGSKTESVGAAKAVITPADYAENISGVKTLTSGAVTVKTGGDVTYGAKGALALTAAGIIDIKCGGDFKITGSQVRVTAGTASMKGGGGTFKLSSSITIDPKKFGGKGTGALQIKGAKLDYKP